MGYTLDLTGKKTATSVHAVCVDNSSDKIMLTESLSLARDILNYINRQVDEHEKEQRLFTIYNKLDARSYTLVNASKFKANVLQLTTVYTSMV